MRKYSYGIIALALSMVLILPPAWAGSKQRHRWEGVAIGVGAAIVGSAILQNHFQRHQRPEPVVIHHYRDHRPPRHGLRHRRSHCRDGYWEVRQVWVPPRVERVWNPGHYNRFNEWVPGRWIEIEKRPGYWKEERVWVAYR